MNYLIKKGDNLYEIAKRHNVSVDDIMNVNPHLNPYNLTIGTYIYIPKTNAKKENYHLKEAMRSVWEQHVFWTRLLIVSIIEHLRDEPETTSRLLRNADDFANLYRQYYGNNVANSIAHLMSQHLVIASKLIHAIINNNNPEINSLNTSWYKNADEIADALSSINPYYNKDELKRMLYIHLDLTKEEVMNRINGNFGKEIETFDIVEKEAIMMADYLSDGISKQFS